MNKWKKHLFSGIISIFFAIGVIILFLIFIPDLNGLLMGLLLLCISASEMNSAYKHRGKLKSYDILVDKDKHDIVEIEGILEKDEEILWIYSRKWKYRKKIMEELQLDPPITLEELKSYKEVFALTNKRWIQKELSIGIHNYVSRLNSDKIQCHRDIISIRFDFIAYIIISDTIGVYVDFDFDDEAEDGPGADIPKREHNKMINVLKTIKKFNMKEGKHSDIYFLIPKNLKSFLTNFPEAFSKSWAKKLYSFLDL